MVPSPRRGQAPVRPQCEGRAWSGAEIARVVAGPVARGERAAAVGTDGRPGAPADVFIRRASHRRRRALVLQLALGLLAPALPDAGRRPVAVAVLVTRPEPQLQPRVAVLEAQVQRPASLPRRRRRPIAAAVTAVVDRRGPRRR